MNRIHQAIVFATERHAGQLRKGTELPYIVHPMEVMTILSRITDHAPLLMAGILHDTVEDTDTTIEEIAALFGEETAQLVDAHTEKNHALGWKERRVASVAHLRTATRDVKLLIMADKLSNLRSIAHDYAIIGDRLWDRFCGNKSMQAWYYGLSVEALYSMENDPDAAWAYEELKSLYLKTFQS